MEQSHSMHLFLLHRYISEHKHIKIYLSHKKQIQEEAPTFACPTLVMRYETERTEGIKAGVSKLVGADYEKILREIASLQKS